MTLTVRLDNALESALARYCTERGVTKSLVVQESLVAYLVSAGPRFGAAAAGQKGSNAPVSANYRAFFDAGLIGAVALGQGADKAAVRARVAARATERKARRSGV
jgi:hypothetical protein